MKNHPLIQRVKRTIITHDLFESSEKHVSKSLERKKVTMGFSGGPDSVFLMVALSLLSDFFHISLHAVHIHHYLRPEAEEEAMFSKEMARKYHISFALYRYPIAFMAHRYKTGIEAAGRMARYESFFQEAQGGFIATGHHANDNHETLFLNLIRGAGLSGLTGIPIKRGKIIRPLLDCEKIEMLDFLDGYQIPFQVDETNQSDRYDRNKIRLEVMPVLKTINPLVGKNMTGMINRLRLENAYIEKETDIYMEQFVFKNPDGTVTIDQKIMDIDRIFIDRVIRKTLEASGLKNMQSMYIKNVVQLFGKATGKQVDLPALVAIKTLEGILCRKPLEVLEAFFCALSENNWMYIPAEKIWAYMTCEDSAPPAPTEKKHTKRIYLPGVKNYAIRSRKAGDTVHLSQGHKSLSRFLIDEKIPFFNRDKLLFLASDHDILGVLNHEVLDGKIKKEMKSQYFIDIWRAI